MMLALTSYHGTKAQVKQGDWAHLAWDAIWTTKVWRVWAVFAGDAAALPANVPRTSSARRLIQTT